MFILELQVSVDYIPYDFYKWRNVTRRECCSESLMQQYSTLQGLFLSNTLQTLEPRRVVVTLCDNGMAAIYNSLAVTQFYDRSIFLQIYGGIMQFAVGNRKVLIGTESINNFTFYPTSLNLIFL